MNKQRDLKACKAIRELIQKWKGRLYLSDWDFEIMVSKHDRPDNAVLAVDPNPAYLQARIYVYPEFFKNTVAQSYLERMVVHELVHCMQGEVLGLIEDLQAHKVVTDPVLVAAVERLTQRISKILVETQKHEGL